MTPTNDERAAKARRALSGYGFARDPNSAVCDLLTDLRHLAEREGLDFDWLAGLAAAHHDEERADAAPGGTGVDA